MYLRDTPKKVDYDRHNKSGPTLHDIPHRLKARFGWLWRRPRSAQVVLRNSDRESFRHLRLKEEVDWQTACMRLAPMP